MVSGRTTITFDTEANAMYYKLGRGKAARSRKMKLNGLEYVVDYDRHGEVIGLEILNLKKALALAVSESSLLLAPLKTTRNRP